MLSIHKSNIFGNEKIGREIALIISKNPKYIGKSIYLNNEINNNVSDFIDENEYDIDNMIYRSKNDIGRTGRKIRKKEVNLLKNIIVDNGLKYASENIDKLSYERSKEIKFLYDKFLDNYKLENQGENSIKLNDLDYGNENGYLIPLPISNFSDEMIGYVLKGKTNYLTSVERNGTIKWELKSIIGNEVDTLLDVNSIDEINNQPNILVDEEKQKLDEETMKKIEKYLPEGEKLGYNEYKPTGDEMIEIDYIYGPNRSGKSFYAARYAQVWSNKFKDWPIYLFSRRETDKVLDDLKNLKRVKIDETLCTEPLTMDDFEKSLVIFDDTDSIVDDKIKKTIQKLKDDIMETGRQKMIYVINTSHLGMNWKPTRTVLNEANSYTLFPRRGNYEANFKILKDKIGIKPDIIRNIFSKNGISHMGKWGWITIYKDCPQYIIYENGVIFL